MGEKEALQVTLEGEDVSDLPALKQVMTKYDEFMLGIAAVEKQVSSCFFTDVIAILRLWLCLLDTSAKRFDMNIFAVRKKIAGCQ